MNVEKTIQGSTKKDPTGGLISGAGWGHRIHQVHQRADLKAFSSGFDSPKNTRF